MKTFTIDNTTWTMSDHLMTRMEEHGIDELDIKRALRYGNTFTSFEDDTDLMTMFEMEPNEIGVSMFILLHKKNGAGREIFDVMFG